MSFQKSQHFNIKFLLKFFQANCNRSNCKVSVTIVIDDEQRSFRDIVEMRKNVAQFNSQLEWQMVQVPYDQISGSYLQKIATLNIHYETMEIGGRLNKIKVGQVPLNLGKLLNSNAHRIQSFYPVEKCYDKGALLKLSVDFSQSKPRQNIIEMNNQRIKTSEVWKTTKIKEKMIEDEKNILQEKVYEYEDRLEKYRDTYGQQVKKLQEQIDKKDQKIQEIINENNSLVSAVQSHQLSIQKFKGKTQKLQQQLQSLKQSLRSLTNQKQSFARQLSQTQDEKRILQQKLDQHEKAKQNKQKYYKQEIQKYNNKYIESQNTRNKIIFQLQSKLKTQLQKKDTYYQQLLKGLQSKKHQTTQSNKQLIKRKQQSISQLNDQLQSLQRERDQMAKEIDYLNSQMTIKTDNNTVLLKQIEGLKRNITSLSNEHQQALFSNETLQKKMKDLKTANATLKQQLQQIKYQLQLAKGTIQENSNKMAKYTKQLQIHKQRQYYLQEKYQDEMEIKSYNQECIIESNQQYRLKINRLTAECKLLKEMVDDLEIVIEDLSRDKKQLEDRLYRQQNVKFQEEQENIVLQNQVVKLKKLLEGMQYINKDKFDRNALSLHSYHSTATFQPDKFN